VSRDVLVSSMSASFDFEINKRQRDTVRAAKLAVLKMQAQQTAEQIDASARQVETLAQSRRSDDRRAVHPGDQQNRCRPAEF